MDGQEFSALAPGPLADGPLDDLLERSARRFGTPQFLYDLGAIEARIGKLRAAFGGRFALSYAVKANPNAGLLAWLRDRIDYLDVSSIGSSTAAATPVGSPRGQASPVPRNATTSCARRSAADLAS